MLDRWSRFTIGLGCLFLLIAALFLALGHDPESFVFNMEAETTANYAFMLLCIGVGFLILDWLIKLFSKKTKKS